MGDVPPPILQVLGQRKILLSLPEIDVRLWVFASGLAIRPFV